MSEWFRTLHPLALVGGMFTWLVTAIGAALVRFTAKVKQRTLDAMEGFAAGAMIFVVVEELIPESHLSRNYDLATVAALTGFVVMMILDLAFG